MLYGFLNCFWGYALKVEAARTAAVVPQTRNYGAPSARRSKGGTGAESGAARLSSPKSSPYTGGSLCQYGQSVGLADFTKRKLRLGKLEICGRKIK